MISTLSPLPLLHTEVLPPIMVQARGYQTETIGEVVESLSTRFDSVIVNSPTGSGKTYMGLHSCRNLILDSENLFGCAPEEVGIAWVTHRENLRIATNRDNDRYILNAGQVGPLCPNLHTISMFEKDTKWFQDRYKVRILVADEGHHAACESMSTMFNNIRPDKTIGLTATPFRTDTLRLCFQKEIKKAGYRALIDQGYLAQFDQYVIDGWHPADVAETYLNGGKDRWGSSLMFFLNRAMCEEAAAILRLNGVRVEVVHGGSERETQLSAFERGDVDVVISMAILTEGFDMPSLRTVFARDTESKGLSIQMSGRALRIYGDKVAQIVQSSKNPYPFSRFARSHRQFVLKNRNWYTIGTNNHVQDTLESMTVRLAQAADPMILRTANRKVKSFGVEKAPSNKKKKTKSD